METEEYAEEELRFKKALLTFPAGWIEPLFCDRSLGNILQLRTA